MSVPIASETSSICMNPPVFYFAEEDHQQYLAKNPHGYCNLGGTGVSCPMPPRGPGSMAGQPPRFRQGGGRGLRGAAARG